jgi:integrase
MALTTSEIESAKPSNKPLKLTDERGLYLEVRPSGAKLWRYRYRIGVKENVFAIGEYAKPGDDEKVPRGKLSTLEWKAARITIDRAAAKRRNRYVFTLAEARLERDKCRSMIRQGIHPSHDRKAAELTQLTENASNFEAVASAWIERNRDHWSETYRHQVGRTLTLDAHPHIGFLPMRCITAAHLLAIIERMEKRGAPSLAILMRQWLSAIFRYAVTKLLADHDPAAALRGAIRRPKVQHKKPLEKADFPNFMTKLSAHGGYRITVIAMRLLMLTFVRPSELRQAEWSEFDELVARWNVPAHRMKMREAHVVPLSAQAISLLTELRALTGGQKFLFPNQRDPRKCLALTTLNRVLERMGYAGIFSQYGWRTTASTLLNELNYRPDVIERQLAHKERNAVRHAYNRAEYLPERIVMMQDWANLIDAMATPKTNVTPIGKAIRAA